MGTIEQVRINMDKEGINVASWAREHGYKPEAVYDVLRGKAKGRRGVSHNIAVSLGIKDGKLNPNVAGTAGSRS